MPKKVRIGLLVVIGVIVLLFSGCALLFGTLIANALGRVEPTHELIVTLSATGGFVEDDVRIAEQAVLTPAARVELNARMARRGAVEWLARPECAANSSWGGEGRSGDFVTCTALVNYMGMPSQMATIVWVKQRANWRVDDFVLRDLEPSELKPAAP